MNLFKIFNARINPLLTISIHFVMLAIHVESSLYGTLNFDRKNNALIDIESKVEKRSPLIFHDLAIACPAQLSHELDFNSNHSFGKNSLFVDGIYPAKANPQIVKNRICKNIYKLSIIFHRSIQEIEFGYEVYYDAIWYSHFKDSNYDEYDSIAKAYSKAQQLVGNLFTSKHKLKLETSDGHPLTTGFVWIRIFRLKFDNSIKRPIQVIYALSKGTEIGAECADYSLGDEVYQQSKEDYMDSLYRNQVNIFKNVDIPSYDTDCEKKNQCLTKHTLVPAEEFRFRSPEPTRISCSNLTTVPIWRSIVEEGLKKLDRFLYALSNVLFPYHATNITVSGVHGQLSMGKSNNLKGNVKISLGEIPVPNIIYKIISYKFGFAQDVYNSAWKAVIIVIHNDPNFKQSDTLCLIENCEEWGWKEILNDTFQLGGTPALNNIFCCPRNEEIAEKIGMKNDYKSTDELNLRKFSVYDEEQSKVVTINIEQTVIDKMKGMFGGKNGSKDD